MDDLISRQAAIEALEEQLDYLQMLNKDENPTAESKWYGVNWARNTIADLPSAQPERLTDDDFETIRIHLSAHKETLCNQNRWKEAEEYQRIIERLTTFASAQSETCEGCKHLPSAQPEIIRCKDCKHWDELLAMCKKSRRVIFGVKDFCSKAERRTE